MFTSLSQDATTFMQWSWTQIEPYYRDLAARHLRAENLDDFLAGWTRVSDRLDEMRWRLYLATCQNTADTDAERRYHIFLDEMYPNFQAAEQRLKEKLLASGLTPDGFFVPLRKMQAEAALFREANLPLLTEEQKLIAKYEKIRSAQTVQWEGQSADDTQRERVWRLTAERQLADRSAINNLWQRLMRVRQQLAANAGFSDYRSFCWQQLHRFDYTPANCVRFHQAIEDVVVPALMRIREKRRRCLGLKTLRPWDMGVDSLGRPPLRPFRDVAELQMKAASIFHRIDPQLGAYFDTMIREGLLDLDYRKNKARLSFCTVFPATKRPFIFMSAVGQHSNVQTLLHEAGHAFHFFERINQPYIQQRRQRQIGAEVLELASIAMEFLAAPYLKAQEGGFYTEADAARARVEHLESNLFHFWCRMAALDAFQFWVYENPAAAMDPANCDAQWAILWQRFNPGVDWSGLEQELMTGWQRQSPIHRRPFRFIEYGFALLGAVQIWRNALVDQAGAVASYRRALALGDTVPIPPLYATAGAKFAFDADTLRDAVNLIEETIFALEPH